MRTGSQHRRTQTIFAELADDYEIRVIERFGHDPRFPVTRDWPYLVDQLLEDIDARRLVDAKVWLVGHSLGEYLSLMAALKRPQWVKGIRNAGFAGDRWLAQQCAAFIAMDRARHAAFAHRRD